MTSDLSTLIYHAAPHKQTPRPREKASPYAETSHRGIFITSLSAGESLTDKMFIIARFVQIRFTPLKRSHKDRVPLKR